MRRRRVSAATLVALLACTSTPGGAADEWRTRAPMPQPRTEVSAAAIEGRVYVVGGLTADPAGTALGSARVDVYDTATDAWSRAPDLPVPVHHTAVVARGTRLIVLGGYATIGFAPMPTAWALDTAAAAPAWEPFVTLPQPRGAHAAVTDGSSIWLFGGVGPTGVLASAYVLAAGATAWSRIPDMPAPREHLAGAFLDGRVYAAGGRSGALTTNTARADAFDPAAGEWTRLPDMPTARGGIAGAAHEGTVVVFGGEAPGGTFDEAEAFDPQAGAWTSLDPMPTARHGLGAAVTGQGVHVLAGGTQPGLFFSGTHEVLRARS